MQMVRTYAQTKRWRLISFGDNYMDINFNILIKLKRKLYNKDLEVVWNDSTDEFIFMINKPRRLERWRCKVPTVEFENDRMKITLPNTNVQLCFEEIKDREEE